MLNCIFEQCVGRLRKGRRANIADCICGMGITRAGTNIRRESGGFFGLLQRCRLPPLRPIRRTLASSLVAARSADPLAAAPLLRRDPPPPSQVTVIASDIPEVIGSAIGLRLLFGTPILLGIIITAVSSVMFLALGAYGVRKIEALMGALVGAMSVSWLIELCRVRSGFCVPPVGQLGRAPCSKQADLSATGAASRRRTSVPRMRSSAQCGPLCRMGEPMHCASSMSCC